LAYGDWRHSLVEDADDDLFSQVLYNKCIGDDTKVESRRSSKLKLH